MSDNIWPVEKARAWQDAQPWPCGFNHIPANAISYTEMWMDYAFDHALIECEMRLAQDIGFNCARVVLPFGLNINPAGPGIPFMIPRL